MKFVPSSIVYEGSNGAISMATSPRITPTPEHILVKNHWFIKNYGKCFFIQNVESENQKADI